MKKKLLILYFLFASFISVVAQNVGGISGRVVSEDGTARAGLTIQLFPLNHTTTSDSKGQFNFSDIPEGKYTVICTEYQLHKSTVTVRKGKISTLEILGSDRINQLEEVTVTAEKTENKLQKVPMAISAISGKQIEERNVHEMGDLVLAVPNLMTMNAGSPTLNVMSIRGVLTFSTDPVVGIYVDGIPMFDGYSASQQLQGIERVEVLRGPQSTLYGRNGLGGVINIITKKPGNTLKGFAEAGIGNYNTQHYALGISGPLVKNKLYAGFSASYDKRDGFFTNTFTGKKYDRPESFNGNFYLKYLVNDRLSMTLNVKGEYNDIMGVFPYVQGGTAALANPYVVNYNGTNQEKRKLLSTSLQVVYKKDKTELSSVTGYTYMSDVYKDYDVDYSPYNAITFEVPSAPQNTLTQEFKIVTDFSDQFKFTGGAFGFFDQKESLNQYIYGPDAAAFDPNAPYVSGIHSNKKTYGISSFANLSYALSKEWLLTGGIRYDYEKRNLLFSTDMEKAPNPLMILTPETKIDGHNGAFSPKLSVSYNPAEDLLFYATYSRGYRSGGFNMYTSNAARLNFKPEYTNNYEVGMKSEWFKKRLRANVAVFYTYWKDQQQTLSLPENLTDNVGELVNKGLELELTGLVAKGLEINYNLGVVDTDYKKLILVNSNKQNQDYAGNKQIFTPNFTSSISVTYHLKINEKLSLYGIPEWKYFGKQYMTYYNDLVQKPFSLLNFSAGIKYNNLSLGIWAKNIGEAKYLSFAYATQMADTTPVLIGNPRTFGANLKFSF
ncbi:hypothetical protein CEY12_07620 [Chryseobacterium sp. T16E-39]|uniref:TonB-dependent receptor n=1 Tax=Chryseobacterium sp. T16E-39 TaxID=2015076 RepID=UPI000B5B3CED|nr:TonB-dependent receptor [Chryseobacterium sp. T16E-39]ASK29983.1 hypothetical protein CEY12_07620 [Chryseobacterium sp. T16E-39]